MELVWAYNYSWIDFILTESVIFHSTEIKLGHVFEIKCKWLKRTLINDGWRAPDLKFFIGRYN